MAANFGDDRSDTEETKEELADREYIHSENEGCWTMKIDCILFVCFDLNN